MGARTLLFVLFSAVTTGCGPRPLPRTAPLPAEALVGTYDLVSIGGRPLPLREFRAVYHAGEITLYGDQRFAAAITAETCTLDQQCSRDTATSQGSWHLLPDGTLALESLGADEHPLGEDEPPPPRIEADGTEIRYHIVAGEAPVFTYRRRP